MPNEILRRGEMRTVDAEIQRIQAQFDLDQKRDKEKGKGWWTKEPKDEISKLEVAKNEGFTYVLRLPLVNMTGCAKKYGPHYNKTTIYFEFVNWLAQSNSIERCKHVDGGSNYVFLNKEDAELLRAKLLERQEHADFEPETIEGDYEELET